MPERSTPNAGQVASRLADAIRTAAACAARSPGFAVLLLVPWRLLSDVLEQPDAIGFLPHRAAVPEERVLVHFDFDNCVAPPDSFFAALADHLEPLLIGVGELRFNVVEKTIKIFLPHDGDAKNILAHDSSSVQVTPAMIEAGVREYALFSFEDRGEWVVDAVYRAMAKAAPKLSQVKQA